MHCRLEGTRVPDDLSSSTARCAVIRGLRCSYNFATSPEIIDLCARLPQIWNPEARPYCVWYPDSAEEDTYRKVAQRYPAMRYQLVLLPDVSIAEEAREGLTQGGDEIYRLIMSSSVNYGAIDDFERSINTVNLRAPAFLNGDTHVRCKLEWRYTIEEDATVGFAPDELDIEEDRHMSPEADEPDQTCYDELTPQEATLLWEPLPLDLPTMKKDLLRQMASYEGNVDQYVGLLNPRSQKKIDPLEALCVIRGIYHNTMFARWWQHKLSADSIQTLPYKPWIIWWPLKPAARALQHLAKRCPSIHREIAIAAIYCNYQNLYQSLNIRPNAGLMEDAEQVGNPFYKQDLEKHAADRYDCFEYTYATLARDMEPTAEGVPARLCAEHMYPRQGGEYIR
ncbi:hypothetical protein BDW72DRAFT_208428 [Aspergillus terricola var. indicus]